MISFAIVTALATAAPQANSIILPRKNYAACLNNFQKSSLRNKVDPAAFSAALKTACTTEAAALKKALVAYDVATGGKRSEAEANADLDLEGYTSNIDASYQDYFEAGIIPE